ncbi:hypothetical protein FOCC_FOCC001127 [Frankliniella occidentalis]|nr:hypothetical protein FOCC_FOCC001127 [Frankliniella occidentalis]
MESCRCDESGPPCAACFTVEEVRKEAALLRDVYLQRAEEIQHQKVLLAASYRRCRDACRELAVEEAAMKECMQSEGAVGLAGLRKLQLIANSQLEAARSAFLVPPVAPAPPAAPAPPPPLPLPPPPPPVVAEQEPLTKRIMICCCSSASAECTNRAVRLGAERAEAESHPPQVLMDL